MPTGFNVHAVEGASKNGCCQCLCPQGELRFPPASLWGSQDLQSGLTQAAVKLLLPWILACVRVCVPPSGVESLFPTAFWDSRKEVLLAFKAKRCGGLFFRCWWAHRGAQNSVLWENLCNVIILQFVGCPPRGYGTRLHHDSATSSHSLEFLFYVWNCGRSFLIEPVLFIVHCSTNSRVILVCLWEEVSSGSFYSASCALLPVHHSQQSVRRHSTRLK